MPADARAPDFRLRDEQGEQVSMRALRGQPVVVTFLYSHCQDTCPITAQTIRGALDDLGHDVPALAISVDPPNDTPASARKFLAEQRTGGRIRFVLGSRAQLHPIWNGYGVTPQRITQEHLAHITLWTPRLPARGLPDRPGNARAPGPRPAPAGTRVRLILQKVASVSVEFHERLPIQLKPNDHRFCQRSRSHPRYRPPERGYIARGDRCGRNHRASMAA